MPEIIRWGARNTVSKVILVISLSLNQAEQKHNLYISLWKQIFEKYRLETWNLVFVITNPMSGFLKCNLIYKTDNKNPDVKILEIIWISIPRKLIQKSDFNNFVKFNISIVALDLLNSLISRLHYSENAGSILYISNKASLLILTMVGLLIFHNKQDV